MATKAFAKLTHRLSKITLSYWLAILLCFLLFFVVSYYSIDPDFGWHLQAGAHYLKMGIPRVDIFTYTAANFPWINHEWLNDTLVASFYNIGGYGFVALFFASLWTGAFVIAGRKYYASVLILASLSVLPFAGIRPVAWTVFFVAILERILNSRQHKYYYLLPLLFLFWANLHGSFVLGLGLLVLWQFFSAKKLPWLVVILSFLAVLINPYGIHVFEEIIRTASDSQLRFRISEWQMFVLPFISIVYVVIISAFHMVFNKKPIKSLLSIPGLMLVLTLSSIRHLPVFVITSMRYLEDYFELFMKQVNKVKLDKPRLLLLILIVSMPILTIVYLATAHIRQVTLRSDTYPSQAVSYLKDKGCPGNVFNSYNFGGYLIWQLPSQKIYIDGRMPSWKYQGEDYFKNYLEVFAKDELRQEEFRKFNIRCVVVNEKDTNYKQSRAVPFGDSLVNEGWRYINEASTSSYSLYILPK